MDYKDKYVKYKTKYLELKSNNMIGGGKKIYHIIGPSGSGKTTLGERLSKLPNTFVIDTDDIDDKNWLEIMENPKNYKKIVGFRKYFDDLKKLEKEYDKFGIEKKNTEMLKKLIEKNKDKNFIMVGHTIDPPKGYKVEGYSIKIDLETFYKQINLRTLESIKRNYDKIKKLINNKQIPEEIKDNLLLFKYKIRVPFYKGYVNSYNSLKSRDKKAKEKNYKILERDEIYKKIKEQCDK